MNPYMRTVYWKMRRNGHSSDDARDLAQEAWEKKLYIREGFGEPPSPQVGRLGKVGMVGRYR